MADFAGAFSYLLVNEGTQFVADPADRGGPTRYGITLATLAAWRKLRAQPVPTAADVQKLLVTEASAIYQANYWAKIAGDQLADNGVACAMMDTAVLCGTSWACTSAQTVAAGLGTPLVIDGNLGPKSVAAINACQRKAFLWAWVSRQQARFVSIVDADVSQRKFLKTWVKRAAVYLDLDY